MAWAAGLFEGEGSIFLKRNKYPILSMRLTDEDVLKRFAAIVGGNINGPYLYIDKKPIWNWTCQKRPELVQILNEFLPWLGARRRERAERALEAPAPRRYHKSRRVSIL